MDKKSKAFLMELMGKSSPSGFEAEAQKFVFSYMNQYADKVETDVLGNVIGIMNPKGKPKVMFAGHCDEVGLILQHIDNNGYLYFQKIGGTYLPALHGQRVSILSGKGKIPGVIASKKTAGESAGAPKDLKVENFWIDIGAKDKKEAEKYVSIGDPAVFASSFEEMPNRLVLSKGFDDKIAVFTIAEIMRRLAKESYQPAIFGVSTVQEEVGTRGATTSSFSINPDIGIAIDVIEASDYPGIDKRMKGEIALGKGPVLTRGSNISPVLFKLLDNTAREAGIPCQKIACPGPTSTDARALQIIRSGVAAALISVPLRYMHTSGEIVSLEDVENIVKLVVLAVKKIKKDMSLLPF